MVEHGIGAAAPGQPQARADPAVGSVRVLTATAQDALQGFQDADLLAVGQVNLVSLDGLVEGLGGRWPLQARQVEAFVERFLFAELAGAPFLMVSTGDVMISLQHSSREAALVTCLRCLRQILQRFLGTSARAVEGVYQVTSIRSGRIEARRVDPDELARLERSADIERDRARDLARATESFVASHGRKVTVACELHPLLNVQNGAVIGRRLAQRVTSGRDDAVVTLPQLAAFAGVDRQRVDWAAVIHGLDQLRAHGETPPCLVVSISYASLSSERGRSAMVDLLKQARAYAGHGVICELSGIEGAPQAQLQEALALLRPLSLFIVGRIESPAVAVWSQLKAVGLRGVAQDCPAFDGPAEFLGWACAAVARARRVAAAALLYDLPAMDLMRLAAKAGATHATISDDAS
jgi:hypothetical protein